MKITILTWLFLGLSFFAIAQTETLKMPTEDEKTALKKVLASYLITVNSLSAIDKVDTLEIRKKLTIQFMKSSLAKGYVMVINDLVDKKVEDTISILAYLANLNFHPSLSLTQTIPDSTLIFKPVQYDSWRKFYYTSVEVVKLNEYVNIRKSYVKNNDTGDSTLVADTLKFSKEFPLTYFIRFDREGLVSKEFKLFCILKKGSAPILTPLEPLQRWWKELDDNWKTAFLKLRKMEVYPKQSELERLTNLSELDFENATFTSFAPLSVFTNVRKLTLKGTSIDNLMPLMKMNSLVYLDISKTNIRSLDGIENFKRLEELYCSGNQLKSLSSFRDISSLVKLDCSENELENLMGVANMVNLKELNISLNIKVKNIDEVTELVNMEKLSFRKIEIKDLSPLRKMKNLVYLDCYNTGITSLEPIRNLQKIFHIDLSNNKVTSLEPIKNYQYLVNLYLNSSSVSDLSVVSTFYLLRDLQISSCPQLTSLGGVHKLENLIVLKCYYTKIGKDEIQRFKKNHPRCAITYY